MFAPDINQNTLNIMKNYALVLFLSLFAFAAKANSPAETALAHPANEMALEVGNDALPEQVAYAEEGISVESAEVDAEQTSALGEPEVECDVDIFVFEYEYSEEGDGYSYEEWGYVIVIEITCY